MCFHIRPHYALSDVMFSGVDAFCVFSFGWWGGAWAAGTMNLEHSTVQYIDMTRAILRALYIHYVHTIRKKIVGDAHCAAQAAKAAEPGLGQDLALAAKNICAVQCRRTHIHHTTPATHFGF
ncbi:hypothetical protein BZA05DRAFT_86495 [Tricharina praecox]|uniref:uncharacterized protein n=1 Tax=Tricharina praecox TaxID=43433 RepID=UPI00221E8F05|nr:uncharacterized protein BZA05DRAFT_86495 [Tricharina praecox]KAI5849232.1 hypothetical protein BZA05DRAFT_86495 [Tricharina praecox]